MAAISTSLPSKAISTYAQCLCAFNLILCILAPSAGRADPPGTLIYKLRGTRDVAATEGEAKTLDRDGIYCWWEGPALKPGYFEIAARARARDRPGLLHFVLCRSGQEAPPLYAVSRTQRATVERGEYREHYCGTFYWDGSYTPRVSDWSSANLLVDWVKLIPIALSAIRDPDPARVKRVLAPRFPIPPIIDGDLSEWARVPTLTLSAEDARGGRYGGTADLSAVCRWGWDGRALYFAAEVQDNHAAFLQDTKALGNLWQYDSIQMAFDAAQDAKTPNYAGDDYEYGFGLTAAGPKAYRWVTGNNLPLGDVPNIAIAGRRDEARRRTIYEAAIPWTELLPFSPRSRTCGMTVIINDNDGDGPQRTWLEWTPGIAGPKDPSAFGELALIDEPPAATEVVAWLVGDKDLSDRDVADFVLNLETPKPPGTVTLRWTLAFAGKEVARGELPANLATTSNQIPLHIPLQNTRFGSLTLQTEVRQDGKLIASAQCTFARYALTALQERLSRIKAQQLVLWERVNTWRQRGGHGDYPRATIGTAGEFVTYCADDLEKRLCERAEKVMDELEKMLGEAAKELDTLAADPARDWVVPSFSQKRLTVRDGAFWDGDRPVFLLGFCGWWQMWTSCRRLADIGMNLAEDSIVAPFALFPENTAQPIHNMVEGTDWAWLRGDEKNFRYSRMIACNQLPDYFSKQHPDAAGGGWSGFCTLHPDLRAFEARYLGTIAEIAARHYSPGVYVLWGENGHALTRHPLEVAAFRKWLEHKYARLADLTAAWGTTFTSFADVGNGDRSDSPVAWYDRGVFNQRLFTEWSSWLVQQVKAKDPQALCTSYPSLLSFDDSSDFSAGIDMEALCQVFDVNACDTAALDYGGKRWAMTSITGFAMPQEMLQAFNPEHPNYDPELHLVNLQQPYPAAYVGAVLWQGFLHGLSAASAWVYERRDGIDSMLTFQPRVMEAYLRTGLDLRRLVEPVRTFQRASAEVAILHSQASVAYNPQHLPEMRAAYEGTFFLDAKVTFVTELTVLRSGLGGLKLLLLPSTSHVPAPVADAIRNWIGDGGTVWLIGNCLTHDTASRPLPPWPDFRPARVGGADLQRATLGKGQVVKMQSQSELDPYRTVGEALLAETRVTRPRRVVGPDGKGLDGVEFRLVKRDGRELMYFINMNKATVSVNLDPRPAGPVRDLLNGGAIQFPIKLAPLEVALSEQ